MTKPCLLASLAYRSNQPAAFAAMMSSPAAAPNWKSLPRPCKRARLPSDQDEHLFDTELICRSAVPNRLAAPAAAEEAFDEEAVEYRASAFLLASYSPFFRRALAKVWGGEGKRLEVTAPPEPLGHLLEWVHSLGKALPEGGWAGVPGTAAVG